MPRFDDAFWAPSQPTEARETLAKILEYELLGPEEPDEEIDESPISRYLVGMLAPFGTLVPVEENEEMNSSEGGEDEPGEPEGPPPMSQALTPSSVGFSCLVSEEVDRLVVETEWGDYERIRATAEGMDESESELKNDVQEQAPTDGEQTATTRQRPPRSRWKRKNVVPEPHKIELEPDTGLRRVRVRKDDEIYIEHVTRRLGAMRAVSVFLVNRRSKPDQGRPPAENWIFQPTLRARCLDGSRAFLPREPQPLTAATDRDLESNALLYRKRREFAVGHGTAVTWSTRSDDEADAIETRTLPRFELPRVEPSVIAGTTFDMADLAKVKDGTDVEALLMPLAVAYRAWITAKRAEVDGLPEDLRRTANDHLANCDEAASRIEGAIELLRDDPDARRAFRFANKAMLLQRSHTEWASDRQDDPALAPDAPTIAGSWRPFQLAFILLTLRGIAEPSHADRRIGDLLWFPTGGGKTEAYLGLAAFTMGLRRLRPLPGYRTDAGVTIVMRYTLRLLTIQQFQRASTLLCACETIRRGDTKTWGDRRFTIGLWLGRQATPNTHAESRRALLRLRKDEADDRSNPCQIESCPWCGENLRPNDYQDDGDAVRTRVFCPRVGCDFAERVDGMGLPVVVVDEEIYRECPSLVIATVDKFAQMPWKGEVQSLFGRVDRECSVCGFLTPDCDPPHPSTHRGGVVRPTTFLAPPELIIQDELHLISGPLGTMVGLYETAVDALCSRQEGSQQISPKVVASTATIRRAYEQVRSLFDRELQVFPPLGLEPETSFFAEEIPPGPEEPGRLYFGVLAPGKSMKTALIRVAAALLSAGAGIQARDAEKADPYLTLVAYFNSLRELGSAVRLMEDDIRARLNQLETRGLPKRARPVYAELTSRASSSEIPGLLRRLKTPHNAPRATGDPLPFDAVLASNMISVGVDVDRLGLMAVLGQPKTTAEYIQATSRVGRQLTGPGLVVTIYNWVRPRDLSHFERFGHYHSTLYRHVEAVSVTPFSARARDRGLSGTFVAYHRLRDLPLAPERAAEHFDSDSPEASVVEDGVTRRAQSVLNDPKTVAELKAELQALADEWGDLAHEALRYGYRHPHGEDHPPDSEVLMKPAEGGLFGHWRVPGSLREVEEQSLVYLRGVRAPGK